MFHRDKKHYVTAEIRKIPVAYLLNLEMTALDELEKRIEEEGILGRCLYFSYTVSIFKYFSSNIVNIVCFFIFFIDINLIILHHLFNIP